MCEINPVASVNTQSLGTLLFGTSARGTLSLPPGVAGSALNAAENAANAGGMNPIGGAPPFGGSSGGGFGGGAGGGSGFGDGGWMGSQDYDPDGVATDDRSGLGGTGAGSNNIMVADGINAHRNPGGPGNDPAKNCGGGDCPGRGLDRRDSLMSYTPLPAGIHPAVA